ncbi:hypothetical protein [Clostridium sp. VAP52]|uniref:hypothetical protein n=1 Tax=Clostridium sp. VAP52 TaxID=2949977 RepID=UPI0020797954|nr:hypothetical protein [Clostridium sp. VAP52]
MLIRLDKVKNGNVYNMVIGENGVPNGAVVKKGTYTEFDTYKAGKLADVTKEETLMLVAPFMNVTGFDKEENMTFAKDEVIRGYAFEKGDVVTLTIDGITNATNVAKDMIGKYVQGVDASYKMTIIDTATATLNFEVLAVEQLDGKDALVLEVK